jgi:signal transduction histidine kinase
MSVLPATAGWSAALAALVAALLGRRELRRRRELVARACHELRGPLTAAGLALSAGAEARDVERELRRAALALEDLAAAGRGGRAPERWAPVDLAELLAHQEATWRLVAPAFGCELRVASPGRAAGAIVRGDGLRLAQAIGNLVANALEHAGGRVEVSARRAGDRVRVEVADEGPGLPAPLAELAGRPRAGRGGRGRGLAIAADVAARHGGRLLAAPAARGARLVLELPAWSRP